MHPAKQTSKTTKAQALSPQYPGFITDAMIDAVSLSQTLETFADTRIMEAPTSGYLTTPQRLATGRESAQLSN
jgi:hypothetical protein